MPKPQNIGEMFLNTLNGAVHRDEVKALFAEMKSMLQKIIAALNEKVAQTKEELTSQVQAHMATVKETEDRLLKAVAENKELTRSEARTITRLIGYEVKRVEALIPNPTDLTPLQEEFEARLAEIEDKIPELPEQENLQALLDDQRAFFESEIDKLRQELKTRSFGGGGGTSAVGVANAMNFALKKETPTGAINGVNTTYTVTKPINAVISFAINGQVINDDEYTISGKTITMDTPLDASLSGTSFRINYV